MRIGEVEVILVLGVAHGAFTPLIFTSTGGKEKECVRFHSHLAELLAAKKGERYSDTITWIRARTSFALLRSALVSCLRGSRAGNYKFDPKNILMWQIPKASFIIYHIFLSLALSFLMLRFVGSLEFLAFLHVNQ